MVDSSTALGGNDDELKGSSENDDVKFWCLGVAMWG